MKTQHFKKSEFLKYRLTFTFFLFILFSFQINSQINYSKSSVSRLYSKPVTTNVVYVFKPKSKYYKGSYFTVFNSTQLVAILKKSYFLNNKLKVNNKYPNSTFYVGKIIGKPRNIQNIYIEPRINDKMVIGAYTYAYNSSRRIRNKIPIKGCENRGDRCKININNSTIYLTVNNASWEPEDYEEVTYPGLVEYKINKIIGTVNLKNYDNPYISGGASSPNPEYIQFTHPLIPPSGVVGNYPYKN